jgi:division protein CdvB (Snf7/Vps24/ESCRT-III family)
VRGVVESMGAQKQVTLQLAKVSQQLEASMQCMFLPFFQEIIGSHIVAMNLVQVAQVMDKFTEKVEDFQILEETVNKTMDQTTANLVVKDDVDDLIRQVADEYNLQLEELLPNLAKASMPCSKLYFLSDLLEPSAVTTNENANKVQVKTKEKQAL